MVGFLKSCGFEKYSESFFWNSFMVEKGEWELGEGEGDELELSGLAVGDGAGSVTSHGSQFGEESGAGREDGRSSHFWNGMKD